MTCTKKISFLLVTKSQKKSKKVEKSKTTNEKDKSESKNEKEKVREPLLTIILYKLIEIGKEVTNSSKKHANMTKTLNLTNWFSNY